MTHETLMQALNLQRASGAAATLSDDLANRAAERTHNAITDAFDLAKLEDIPAPQRASVLMSIAGAAAASAVAALAATYGAALGLSYDEAASPRMRRIVTNALLQKMEEDEQRS